MPSRVGAKAFLFLDRQGQLPAAQSELAFQPRHLRILDVKN